MSSALDTNAVYKICILNCLPFRGPPQSNFKDFQIDFHQNASWKWWNQSWTDEKNKVLNVLERKYVLTKAPNKEHSNMEPLIMAFLLFHNIFHSINQLINKKIMPPRFTYRSFFEKKSFHLFVDLYFKCSTFAFWIGVCFQC